MADGTAVRVGMVGEGEKTIVLLHGYLESMDIWEDFIRLLKPLRVVTIDLPGHGISEVKGSVHTMEFLADTVHAAMHELGVAKSVICGHSMGGYVALEFLRKYPDELDGIILFHSVAFADTPEKAAERLREIAVVEAGKKDLLAASVAHGFAAENRRKMAAAISELSQDVLLVEEEGVLALLRGMGERKDNNDVLKQSPVPQLFIYGRGDEFIPVSAGEEMEHLHPHARTVWLEHSGHVGFIEEAQLAAEEILKFVNQ